MQPFGKRGVFLRPGMVVLKTRVAFSRKVSGRVHKWLELIVEGTLARASGRHGEFWRLERAIQITLGHIAVSANHSMPIITMLPPLPRGPSWKKNLATRLCGVPMSC
jgi:hypothetical protein